MSVTKLVTGVRGLSKKLKGNAKRSSIGLVKRAQREYYVSFAQLVAVILSSSHKALQAALRSEKGRASLAKLIEHVMVDLGSRLNELGNLLETIGEDKEFSQSVVRVIEAHHQFRMSKLDWQCREQGERHKRVESKRDYKRELRKAGAAYKRPSFAEVAKSCRHAREYNLKELSEQHEKSWRREHGEGNKQFTINDKTGECTTQVFNVGAQLKLVHGASRDSRELPPDGTKGTILRVTWLSPSLLESVEKREFPADHPFCEAYYLLRPDPQSCFLLEVEWDGGWSAREFLLTAIDEVEVLCQMGPPWDEIQATIKARLESGNYSTIKLSEYHKANKFR
jgi:hypothetical protein